MGKETSIHTEEGSRETGTRLLEVKEQTLEPWLLVGQTQC